eukprot:UN14698
MNRRGTLFIGANSDELIHLNPFNSSAVPRSCIYLSPSEFPSSNKIVLLESSIFVILT